MWIQCSVGFSTTVPPSTITPNWLPWPSHDAPVPAHRRTYRDEEVFDDWSGSGSGEGGGDFDDESDGEDDWDSYGDDEDEEAAGDATLSEDSSDLDYRDGGGGSGSFSREDEEDFWSDDDGFGGGGRGDSWDEDGGSAPEAAKSRQRRAGGPPSSRRPRPSAWTGDDRIAGRRRRQPGRSGAGGGSSVVSRYQRGRPAPATRGFAVRMPAVNGAALASALRRQMGTAREAVGQAGSLAASTSKRLKREVVGEGSRGIGGKNWGGWGRCLCLLDQECRPTVFCQPAFVCSVNGRAGITFSTVACDVRGVESAPPYLPPRRSCCDSLEVRN